MRKLHERLFKIAPCLVAAVVVMPAMADDTAFALDQERLSLNLVLPDAAGAFPTNASPYWEKVSRVEFTNILERISKMTRLKSLSLDVRAMKKLKRLVLNGGYELGDLGALRECRSLENIEIAFCDFRPLDLSVLNGLPLKELKLKSCLVHEVKGLEKCPLKKISIDFCPIASFDDFGLFPNVRIVELRRTGIRSADRDAVLRHFPRIWSLLYGDLIEGFCDGDRCNEVVCFGPTNIVFAAGGDKAKGLSFMGFDMDSSIVYGDKVSSLCEVFGMSNCVWDTRCESVIGLGRPFHGFTTVKLVGREVEIVGDEAYDGRVDSLEFEQEDEGAVFDFSSEKKWAIELAAEMERVYGATFCWDDTDETATGLIVEGKSDAFNFVISSNAGSSETHCSDGEETRITRREYRGRQFYVSRRGSAESAPEQSWTDPAEPL